MREIASAILKATGAPPPPPPPRLAPPGSAGACWLAPGCALDEGPRILRDRAAVERQPDGEASSDADACTQRAGRRGRPSKCCLHNRQMSLTGPKVDV